MGRLSLKVVPGSSPAFSQGLLHHWGPWPGFSASRRYGSASPAASMSFTIFAQFSMLYSVRSSSLAISFCACSGVIRAGSDGASDR